MPGKCLVGVMGWLLSCLQSYTETIGLLYSSNIFKFDDWSDTLRYIPQLILPQRLAALRYVEIQYCMRGKTVAETTQADTSPFDALLRSMSQVEIVHISLYGGDLTPLDRKPQMDKVDLKRQRMVYEAGERWTHILTDGRLKHLYLAVPSSVYNRWQQASSRQSNQSIHDYPGPRFWRAINTPAPSSEAATESPSTETPGYWIVRGMDDYIPRESHCFQPS
ncbi:hypothetical protein C2857_006042 [Epichloe festucae Fl1]|uniref:DUF7730 domain-containing protein n=1 Tax=Epichloe festucae (strain Fl1) TaxID=877507 RepID=A0A7S9KLB9_EPIFF|nr:hypothetical protein C2857_006042 [Epichloe festucae Fl1]